jgi:hypothetical protein
MELLRRRECYEANESILISTGRLTGERKLCPLSRGLNDPEPGLGW